MAFLAGHVEKVWVSTAAVLVCGINCSQGRPFKNVSRAKNGLESLLTLFICKISAIRESGDFEICDM